MEGLEIAQSVLKTELWLPTPLLRATAIGDRLGMELWLKREDCTPVGSFKLRGALVAMARRADGLPGGGVCVASAGNYGLAIAVAGQRRNVDVTVVAPENATPSKLDRVRLCGAKVIQHGNDFDAAKDFARNVSASEGKAFWEDGVIEEMAFGAATIADELLDGPDPWDSVIVPVGNGSLIKGVAGVFKARSPATTVVGAVPSGAPSMASAIRGEPWDEWAAVETYADGLAVRVPINRIVEEIRPLVDDVWLVEEAALLPAVKSLIEREQVLAEPSAAITLAALAQHRAEFQGKRVVAILTGAHLRPSLLPEVVCAQGLL